MKIASKYWILASLTPVIVLLDQWTKSIVFGHFRVGETLSVIPDFFNLTFVKNPGAAFGLFASAEPSFRVPFFLIIPVIALAAIAYVFRKLPAKDILISTALSLVIGGAVGNLLDRFSLNYVIDFLDFHWKNTYHFPAFNVADSAICVGVCILVLDMLIHDRGENVSGSR